MRGISIPGPTREASPCRTCANNQQRPACRKECEKDAAWHEELERIKGNRRKYVEQLGIGFKNK